MDGVRQLVPRVVLFGRVIAYKCTACERSFLMPLLDGAVGASLPTPAMVRDSFLRHVCEDKAERRKALRWLVGTVLRGVFSMAGDDDFPVAYLLYVLAVIGAMGLLAVSIFFLFLR